MKHFIILLTTVTFFVEARPALAQKRAANPLSPEQLREEEAYSIGLQAYVYGFPVVEMYRLRYLSASSPTNPNRTPINQFRRRRELIDHTYTAVVSPNSDTLYSSAWLDLAPEPMILHVPDTKGRYYVFQFLDFYTNNFASIGTRTTGAKQGNFVVTGPKWNGSLPSGLKRISSPTNAALLVGRTLINGTQNLANVHRFQDDCTLTPLSAWGKDSASLPGPEEKWPPYDGSNPLKFFESLNAGLRENPPPARDGSLMSLFERISVGPDQTFAIEKLDPAVARGLRRALDVGKQMIANPPTRRGTEFNGWYFPAKHIGNFGDDFLFRAEVALKWIFALSPEEAVYFIGERDDHGAPLMGKQRYVLRFESGQMPPMDAFWSITMYRVPDRLLAGNSIRRYSISDRTPGLKLQSDGALEIYVQHEAPEKDKESNWLPAPAGEFNLILRVYLPRKEVLDGTWKVPAVKRFE
jgi:hypothetical protein